MSQGTPGSGGEQGHQSPRGARITPADLLTLQTYDLVIFENVGADALAPDRQRLLLSYVKDLGGGLLIVGGPDAFGGGGWRGSELASIFPVQLELPDRIVTLHRNPRLWVNERVQAFGNSPAHCGFWVSAACQP